MKDEQRTEPYNETSRCAQCGKRSGTWPIREVTRKYDGDGYSFQMGVKEPFCPDCGAPVYCHRLEEEIRERAHARIAEQRKSTGRYK
jgi:hypothetical protein